MPLFLFYKLPRSDLMFLRMTDHAALDISDGTTNLFAWIEDIVWVKYILGSNKEFVHLGAEFFFKIRRADDAVIVLTRDDTVV